MIPQKVVKLIEKRIPYKFNVRFFKTTLDMLKQAAVERGDTLKVCITWYNEYLSNPEKATYIDSKYDMKKAPTTAMEIAALGGEPIFLSLKIIKDYSCYELTFLLLHEIGHNILGTHNEGKCDQFAIRWIKKFIAEGLVKYKGG